MINEIWIESKKQIDLKDPIAIVGSPGLGSIGKLVVDELIKESKAELTTFLVLLWLFTFIDNKIVMYILRNCKFGFILWFS